MPSRGAAPPSTGRREVRVDVEEDGSRNVPRPVRVRAPPRGIQVPANVDDPEACIPQPRRQPVGRDERPQRYFCFLFFSNAFVIGLATFV